MKHKALLLMACVAALAMLAVPAMTPPADAAFTVSASCDADGYATVTWAGKTDASDRVRILIKAPDSPTWYIASSSSNLDSIAVSKQMELGTEYTVKATAKHNSDNTDRETTQTAFTCTAPPVFTADHTCNADGTATVSWRNPPAGTHDYLLSVRINGAPQPSGTVTGNSWNANIEYGSTYFMRILAYTLDDTFLGRTLVEFTCADPTATPPPATPDTTTPDTTTPDTTTPDQTTRTTGGGGGGGGTGSGSFFIAPSPSRSAPEPEEPEPYQPVLTNGTITNVRMASVPLNATIWYGAILEPFQCDIAPTGHFNVTGVQYEGMAYHDILVSNVTHANATRVNATYTIPATYNVTINVVAEYDLGSMERFGALVDVDAGGHIWTVYNHDIPTFRDIFGTVAVTEIRQYGDVHWAAADGTCRSP